MRPFAIAGLQLEVSGRRSNLAHITDRIEMVMHLYPWVQMVLVSELATFGGWTGHAMPLPSEVEDAYRRLAARHEVWLVPGSLYEQTDAGIYNTAPVINPAGEVVARYRKMFPFLPYEAGVQSGTEFCVFDVPEIGRFGLSICYDMWFPETSRTLAAMGAEVILHPTLTPTIDRDVELSIVRATAAMNQCFVVDINGVGDGGNGRSILCAPSGDVLYQAGSHEELLPIEIDLDRVRRSREVGLKGLGQPLKSFRDRHVEFGVYQKDWRDGGYLDTLGSLEMMARGSRAGIAFGQNHPHADASVPPPAEDPGVQAMGDTTRPPGTGKEATALEPPVHADAAPSHGVGPAATPTPGGAVTP
ncbi:MAG: carbon-nitrogen hydrolase family protein [Planctomycetota bacterium]